MIPTVPAGGLDRTVHTRAALEKLQRSSGVIDSPQVLKALEAAWDDGWAKAAGVTVVSAP